MELTPNQIADALRKCVHDDTCSGCPYRNNGCKDQLMSDAAALIEAREAIGD